MLSERICKPVHSFDKVPYYHLEESWAFCLIVLDALDYFIVTIFGHVNGSYFHLKIKNVSNHSKNRDPPSNRPQRQEIKYIKHFYFKLPLNDRVLILSRELNNLL